jgi:NSS family neurotransmitter:Na+ symporter
MAAFGQIVFSLSLGMSIAFTYASYTGEDADLITNTISIALANSLFENFAALGVFSILGYMSLQSGTAVADLVTQGTGLVFVVYPTVFNVLGQWAYVLGPLFFLTVYLAGLTSILSTIEPLSFSIQNKFGHSRSKTMTILIIFGAVVSMIYATSYGGSVLGYVDTFINQIALLLGIILECIIFAWIFNAEKLIGFLNARSKTIKLGKWWLVIVKFILPIFIAVVWIGGMIDVINNSTSDQLIFTVTGTGGSFIGICLVIVKARCAFAVGYIVKFCNIRSCFFCTQFSFEGIQGLAVSAGYHCNIVNAFHAAFDFQ